MRDNVSRFGTAYTGLALPAANTGNITPSSGVDTANFNAATLYILAGTWTDGTHTFTIEESDSASSGFTTVANADLVAWSATSASDYMPVKVGNAQPTAISSAATAINWRIGYIGGKRYVRVKVAVSGVTTGAVYDTFWILGEPRNMPSVV